MTHYSASPIRRTHEFVWGLAFLMFGLGAMAAVVGATVGWTELMARIYYIAGAILAVGFLGIGELVLLANATWRRIAVGAGITLAVVTVVALFTSPFDPALLATEAPWKSVAPTGSFATRLAAISNIGGTVLIVGGTLYSAWVFYRKGIMKNRMYGCLLLVIGTFVAASGGFLVTNLHEPSWHYPPMAVGIAIMFVGYIQTTRQPAPAREAVQTLQPAAIAEK